MFAGLVGSDELGELGAGLSGQVVDIGLAFAVLPEGDAVTELPDSDGSKAGIMKGNYGLGFENGGHKREGREC